MVNMLHHKLRVNDGFGVSKVMISTQDKKEDKEHRKLVRKFEDVELQAFLDEKDLQTQKQLAEQLDVSQQTVFNRPREMGKIQKTGR